jgi:hypothetical protein
MNYIPETIWLLEPKLGTDGYYCYFPFGTDNQSCIGLAYVGYPPQEVFLNAVNCAGSYEWPDVFVGNKQGKERLYVEGESLSGYNFPLLKENLLVAGANVWSMCGDIPAGCEPKAIYSYIPDYSEHWDGSSGKCGVAENDYRYVVDYFHLDDHKSYMDFFYVHDGNETNRVSIKSYEHDPPLDIPAFQTQFNYIIDYYQFEWRSQHVLQTGEQAKMIMQISSSPTFTGTPSQSESYATLVQHWHADPPPGQWIYDYHEALFGWFLPTNTTFYIRCKRHDELISDPNTFTESDWSDTLTIQAADRVDEVLLNNSPAYIPFYCYQHYIEQRHYWSVFVQGKQGRDDQNADLIRLQISESSDFATIYNEFTWNLDFGVNGYVTGGYGKSYTFINPKIYYARCRYETSDGVTLGAWSNVFSMDGGNEGANHVDRSNYFSGIGITVVTETHWTGDLIEYLVVSNPYYKNGHVYVVLGKERKHDEAGVKTYFGSLWLADYDGTEVHLTVIISEIQDFTPSWWSHTSIVEFQGKLYADCTATYNTEYLFDWCEITDGIVGTIYHVSIPSGISYVNWSTIAVIHGGLRVIAGLDDNSSYFLGISDILSDDLTMKTYPDIKVGWYFIVDPWERSIWFDYTDYNGTETGLCWLGPNDKDSQLFPWVGKFQLQKEV